MPGTVGKDKLGRRLFQAGGVFLLVIGAVHALSLIRPLEPRNDTERQLLGLMTGYKFNLLGSLRSMDNLMTGFSVSFMLAAFVVGALALGLRQERSPLLKRFAGITALWLLAMTAVSFHFFFAAPTSFLVA